MRLCHELWNLSDLFYLKVTTRDDIFAVLWAERQMINWQDKIHVNTDRKKRNPFTKKKKKTVLNLNARKVIYFRTEQFSVIYPFSLIDTKTLYNLQKHR